MASLSTIGPTTSVRGNVQGDGDLEILGRVEGSVSVTGDVTIGEGALIQSDVRGRRVIVRGAVAGNVSGDEAVILEAGARVVGDLGAPQIGIRPGALVRGQVSTGAPLEAGAPATTTTAARAAAPATRAAATTAARPRPAEPARAPARPAPRAAPPPRPPARPAPPVAVEAKPAAAPEPRHAPSHEDAFSKPSVALTAGAEDEDADAATPAGRPPPPVVPALRKGAAKATMRRKGGR